MEKHNEYVNKCVNGFFLNKDMMKKYEKDREKEIENNIPKSFDDLLGHLVNKQTRRIDKVDLERIKTLRNSQTQRIIPASSSESTSESSSESSSYNDENNNDCINDYETYIMDKWEHEEHEKEERKKEIRKNNATNIPESFDDSPSDENYNDNIEY